MPLQEISTKQEFQKLLHDNRSKLTVVYFSAAWCANCKFIAPTVDTLQTNETDVAFAKVDIDKASDVSSEVGITSVPSFVMYSGEKVVCQLPGPNAEQLQAAVKSFKPIKVTNSEAIDPTPGAPPKAQLIAFSEELFLSSQPSAEQLKNINLMGIKSVINMRCSDEKGFIPAEENWIKSQGLHYAQLPVRYANDIDQKYTEKVLKTMQEFPRPILIHCAVGLTAAMLSCIDMAIKMDASPQDVLQWGMDLGYNFANQAQFYQFLQNYLESRKTPPK